VVELGSTLKTAHDLLTGDRAAQYGNPRPNYVLAAKLASLLTDLDIGERDIYLIMVAVKLARESQMHTTDNLVDAVAYIDMLSYAIEQDTLGEQEPTRGRMINDAPEM
jgi:hypothetical protein